MQINIARSSGFCFGVRRAIDICVDLSKSRKQVYVLGDIVHNSHVVNDLARKGIRKKKRISPDGNAILVISAHGASRETFKKAREKGYRIIDATCPKVKDIYKIARRLEKNNTIIIIGDKGHSEVKGIAGQLRKKPITIESPDKIPLKKLRKVKRAAVVTQSTQTIGNINNIMEKLVKIVPGVRLHNTTCRITVVKQREIETLPLKNDIVLIIGSPTSANTKRLFQIAKKINGRTYWIESEKDLKKRWFKGAEKVGIMAGASTPDEVVDAIVSVLKTY